MSESESEDTLNDEEREEIIYKILEEFEAKELERLSKLSDNKIDYLYEEYETHIGEYPELPSPSKSLQVEIADSKRDNMHGVIEKCPDSKLLDIYLGYTGKEYERAGYADVWNRNGFNSEADFWKWKEG